MTFNAFRLPTIALGSAALISLAALSPASAAVHHQGSHGMGVHQHGSAERSVNRSQTRTANVVHRTTSNTVHRTVTRQETVSVGRRYVHGSSRQHGYGWGAAAVAGTAVGGGYAYQNYNTGVGYGYVHHSCSWYYNNEPYHIPSWCGSSGYSYGYGGPAVSYGPGGYGGYRHGYYRQYTSNGHWQPTREVVTTNRVRVTRTSRVTTDANRVHISSSVPARVNGGERHMAHAHGVDVARVARTGGHIKLH